MNIKKSISILTFLTYCLFTFGQSSNINKWFNSKVITINNDTLVGLTKRQEITKRFDFKETKTNKIKLFDSRNVLEVYIDSTIIYNSIFVPNYVKGIKLGYIYLFGKLLGHGKYKFYEVSYTLKKKYYLFQGDKCIHEHESFGGLMLNLYRVAKYFDEKEIKERLENSSFTINDFAKLINEYK